MTVPVKVGAWLFVFAVLGRARAQTTLSGCHFHGMVEYCILNGVETAVGTSSTEGVSSAGISSTSTEGVSSAGTITQAPTTAAAAQTTALTDCHMHGATQFCVDASGNELMAMVTGSATGSAPPSSYTGCHAHDTESYCYGSDGEETLFAAEAAAATAGAHEESESAAGGRNCHFHAGVEHCVGGNEEHSCGRVDRDYNVPVRIGTLFAILITSVIGVFAPIFLARFASIRSSFTVIKQFGTGVIISTALVHLLTHAQLIWANECLGELSYEATATAIAIAGAFITFLFEYIALRFVQHRRANKTRALETDQPAIEDKNELSASCPTSSLGMVQPDILVEDRVTVGALEAGIIFHSIILGVTLVVAGNSAYIVLFIVILFHQVFEGLALGARIAALTNTSLWIKCLMAGAFAVTTPIGMAIGLGVLDQFNGNDKSTIIAIGTLDSLSAGILLWTGLVGMWAHDWIYGELRNASLIRTSLSMLALVSGIILMSVLGKWA